MLTPKAKELLFWLCDCDGEYRIERHFHGGAGLTRKDVGGKWQSISEELLKSMHEDGLLKNDRPTPLAHLEYWKEHQ